MRISFCAAIRGKGERGWKGDQDASMDIDLVRTGCAQHDDVMMLLFAFSRVIFPTREKELADLQLPRQAREMINRSTPEPRLYE